MHITSCCSNNGLLESHLLKNMKRTYFKVILLWSFHLHFVPAIYPDYCCAVKTCAHGVPILKLILSFYLTVIVLPKQVLPAIFAGEKIVFRPELNCVFVVVTKLKLTDIKWTSLLAMLHFCKDSCTGLCFFLKYVKKNCLITREACSNVSFNLLTILHYHTAS